MNGLKLALWCIGWALVGIGIVSILDEVFGISEQVQAKRHLEEEYRDKVDILEMRYDILVSELKKKDQGGKINWDHL